MRFFSLLYSPAEMREAATALFVIDAEIRESAQSVNHDVAHTRLQWWRLEIDRLINGTAQHPAARLLNPSGTRHSELAKLHESIVAADMDLARLTYSNLQELRAYGSRSGGSIAELLAMLLGPTDLDAQTRAAANRIGVGVRLTEIIRDCRADAYGGRLYLPLDMLDAHGVVLEDFTAAEFKPAARAALRQLHVAVAPDLDTAIADVARTGGAYLRPLLVLGTLHRQLLKKIAALDFQVATARVELGAFAKPWTAWRAARSVR
jgi:phytoene synthase